MKWFGAGAKKPSQALEEEIEAIRRQLEKFTGQLADIDEELRQARDKERKSLAENAIDDAAIAAVSVEELEAQRHGIEKTLAELQRRRRNAEQRFAVVQEAVAAARTKPSDKRLSAIEVCAGEVRWHSGLLEQLWHIHYFGPTGAIEKTVKEWQLVPELEEPAIAGHIRRVKAA